MPPETQTAERIAFGSFELETASGELFRNGRRIRLSGQPADLLVILVRRSGQLVTREELRLALWPEDTFVDFDHGLNNCIRRIRDALGDPSDSPRFIETLPKKGYRFIAETRTISPQQNGSVSPVLQNAVLAPDMINAAAPLKRDPSQVSVSDKLADARGRGRFRSWLPAGAVILIVGLATAIWYLRRPLPAAASHRIYPDHSRRPPQDYRRNRRKQDLSQSGVRPATHCSGCDIRGRDRAGASGIAASHDQGRFA